VYFAYGLSVSGRSDVRERLLLGNIVQSNNNQVLYFVRLIN